MDNDQNLHTFDIIFHLGARKISIVNTRNQRFIILDELFTKRWDVSTNITKKTKLLTTP